MDGYAAVLAAYRAQARRILAAAQTQQQRAWLKQQFAERVLRNLARLLVARLNQTAPGIRIWRRSFREPITYKH